MTYLYRLSVVLLLIPVMTFAFNSSRFGSRGFLHVQSASTLNKGTLDFRSNLNFYTKVGDFLGAQKPENFAAVNWWNVQYNAVFTYGLVDHFDVTLMWRIYQDTNRRTSPGREGAENDVNAPEDLYFDLKTGSWGISNNRFHLGLLGSIRIPTQSNYNYFMEVYSAGGVEYGFTGLISFFNDPYLHDRSFSVHLNLGWYNHNDAGNELYRIGETVFKADGNSTAFQYGAGFTYPTELFDLNLEFWGNQFIDQPDSMAYSREDFAYITPSVKFKPNQWFNFLLGLDVRVSGDKNTSSSLLPAPSRGLTLPNNASWKLHLQANFRILPYGGGEPRVGEVRSKADFYEKLLRDREKSRNIEDELRRLRKEREQAEKELEELRQMLEEEEQ